MIHDVTIFTDGACSGNPGPGGYGAVLMAGPYKKELSGGEAYTTNNRMEMMAVITALKALKEPCRVTIYSDSEYVVNAIQKGWMQRWHDNGWKLKSGPCKNPDLWEEIYRLLKIHDVTFIWVKGHAENEWNNRCDELAVAESNKFKK